ncbi:MAG: hypothetical protein ACI9S8_000910 [Chlamydiales bacterium]|jgi:hypothetical protein
MDNQAFQHYLKQSQQLSIASPKDKKNTTDLLDLIEDHLRKSQGNDTYEYFFKGERAFYKRQYKLSLKYYSMARQVPNFRFFCHRATVHVFKNGGRVDEAINFAWKALEMLPTDYLTLKALENLLRDNHKENEARSVQETINNLATIETSNKGSFELNEPSDIESTSEETPEEHTPVALCKKELDELSDLFNNDVELQDAVPLEEDSFLFKSPENEEQPPKDTDPKNNLHKPLALPESTPIKSFTEMLNIENTIQTSMTEDVPDDYLNTEEAIEELKKLAGDELTSPVRPKKSFFDNPTSASSDIELSLEKRVEQFQQLQSQLISHYVEQSKHRTNLSHDFLYILNGWNYQQERDFDFQNQQSNLSSFLLPEYRRRTCGGIYLRWNGKGIVINPGMNFLENFHNHGLFVKDIDYVIVTRDNPDAYADVKGIYDLNYQHNTVSTSLHIINYYLNQKAFNGIATLLKPNFKQERNTVHCLDLYIDSPDVEVLSLGEGVSLRYFYTSSQEPSRGTLDSDFSNGLNHSCLGIRLELEFISSDSADKNKQILSLGFASGVPWSPLLASNLLGCDIIIAGFEKTNVDDYSKIKHNDDCLGYYGTFSLAKEVRPRLLLSCEYSGREGDIRMEVVKKMREELATSEDVDTVILPGDTGFYLDLNNYRIKCSVSNTFVDPKLIRVAKSTESFGALKYLGPSCFI